MAARASAVDGHRCRDERRFDAVAAHAHAPSLRDEIVGLVAAEARVVVRRFRARGPLVARTAGLHRRLGRLVRVVAILATLALGVVSVGECPFVVTGRAILRCDGGGGVRVVAIAAVDGCMLRDLRVRSLRFSVATETGGGVARGKRVAGEATRRMLSPGMGVRGLLGMAARAYT